MTGPDKIMASAQAGIRHFAAAHLPGQSNEPAPHKRQPRRELFAQDKLICRRVEIDDDYRYCFRQWRHARKPKHAKQKAPRSAATVTQDRLNNTIPF